MSVCLSCGCEDRKACVDSNGNPCSWVRVDRSLGLGACSMCPESVSRWDVGDKTIEIYAGKYFGLYVTKTQLGEQLEIRRPQVALVADDPSSLGLTFKHPMVVTLLIAEASYPGGKIEIHLTDENNKPVFAINDSTQRTMCSRLVRTAAGVVALSEDNATPIPALTIPTKAVEALLELVTND